MTPRDKLQLAYELAFHPPRLNATWNDWDHGRVTDVTLLRETIQWALTLHQRLPETPAASLRALRRLALYQATSRLYRMPTMLRRFRERLGGTETIPEEVPAWMVRDIGLPIFGRVRSGAEAAPMESNTNEPAFV
ncbi:MAG: hypothetical protein HYY24_04455 [Verrucomicrobia bacterium]|nr:hypothetical protein [Verrucomicrobiota bacterium]